MVTYIYAIGSDLKC